MRDKPHATTGRHPERKPTLSGPTYGKPNSRLRSAPAITILIAAKNHRERRYTGLALQCPAVQLDPGKAQGGRGIPGKRDTRGRRDRSREAGGLTITRTELIPAAKLSERTEPLRFCVNGNLDLVFGLDFRIWR